MRPRANAFPPGLYLVANFTGQPKTQFLWKIEEALKGGVSVVQFRAKNMDDREFLYLAEQVQLICQDHGRPLIINDNVMAAKTLDASGVHLGAGDMAIPHARSIMGQYAIIGASIACNQRLTPELDEADYLAASPVFPTRTKRDLGGPFGLAGLSALISAQAKPVVAIGGISEKNIREVLNTGCRSIAMVSAIMEAGSPQVSASELKKLMDSGHG